MNDKIGLVTFYNGNFGSILQCYATKTTLERMGLNVVVLDERREEAAPLSAAQKIEKHLKATLRDPGYLFEKIKYHGLRSALSAETASRMNSFVQKEFQPVCLEWDDLSEYSETLNACIVGSDQVWNFSDSYQRIYGLEFLPREKRIAFAVSLGVEKVDDQFTSRLRHVAGMFAEISVREETGRKLIAASSATPVMRIADPTLLLTQKEWEDFSSAAALKDSHYVLAHFLDRPSVMAVKKMREFEKKSGKKVLFIGYYYDLIPKMGWCYQDCGPTEYVAYIKEADCIFTDSYHTSIFSINLGKQFYVFPRMYRNRYPQTSRITDLLSLFGLSNRYITAELPPDYDRNEAAIDAERQKTKNYLEQQIKKRVI